MDKLWDEELKSKIFCALGPDEGDGPDENEVWECIQQDRKHQREEWLKQLPSVEEIDGIIKFNDEMKELLPLPYKAIAIRGLIKEKLGEEVR